RSFVSRDKSILATTRNNSRIVGPPGRFANAATPKSNDNGGVVGGFLQGSWFLVDLAALQPFSESWREQKVVNSNAAIVLKSVPSMRACREIFRCQSGSRSERRCWQCECR